MSARLMGLNDVLRKIDKTSEVITGAASAGLYDFGVMVMRAAKDITPVDYDVLRPSGYTTLPVQQGSRILVELGYGGPATPYAIKQHEHTEYRHPNGGEAKYLEKPVMWHVRGLALALMERVSEALAAMRMTGPKKAVGMPETPWEIASVVAVRTALTRFGIRRYRLTRASKSPHMQPLIKEAEEALVKSGKALPKAGTSMRRRKGAGK